MRGIWKHNITICLTALLFALTGNSYAGNVEVKLPTNSAFQVISGVQPLMHVGSNGNVGIGTTTPTAKLTVMGGGSPPLVVQGSSLNYGMLGLKGDGVSDMWQLQATDGYGSGGQFRIAYPQNSPKLAITQDGNVGIGTTSPMAPLEIANTLGGKISFNLNNKSAYLTSAYEWHIQSTGGNLYLNPWGTENVLVGFGDPNLHNFLVNGSIGIGTTSPSYKLHVNGTAAGTSWTNLSSREFKEDIKVVGESEHPLMLAKLMEMDLNRYRYKKEYGGDDDTTKLGFIAEEMPKEVLSKDGKGVDVYELLAFTIGAMKAQQKEIESQRQYNKALEDRLAALEKMLEGK